MGASCRGGPYGGVDQTPAKTLEQKDGQIEELRGTIMQLQATINNINETIEEFHQKFFGSSSEKSRRKTDQGQQVPEPEKVTGRSHTRERIPKSRREALYADLPVREARCALPKEDRFCPDCGTLLETIACTFVREELRITPVTVERIHYIQEVLACPAYREEDSTTIVKAATPTALFPYSPASPSMAAYFMYQKFMNAVPFYRQEMDWLQMGAPHARETISNWCIKGALAYFQPVYGLLHEYLLKRDIFHADETVCQVLHEEGKEASSNSYFWIYLSGNDGLPPIILYEYQLGRKGKYAKNFLEGFSGLLECNGYTKYNRVENITLVCCLAHCRRYFFEAIPSARRRKLKLLDIGSPEDIPEEAAAPEERRLKRLEVEVPVWDSFWSWLETLKPAGKGGWLCVRPQGAVGQLPAGREMRNLQ